MNADLDLARSTKICTDFAVKLAHSLQAGLWNAANQRVRTKHAIHHNHPAAIIVWRYATVCQPDRQQRFGHRAQSARTAAIGLRPRQHRASSVRAQPPPDRRKRCSRRRAHRRCRVRNHPLKRAAQDGSLTRSRHGALGASHDPRNGESRPWTGARGYSFALGIREGSARVLQPREGVA